jgi:hypothetical protein
MAEPRSEDAKCAEMADQRGSAGRVAQQQGHDRVLARDALEAEIDEPRAQAPRQRAQSCEPLASRLLVQTGTKIRK